MLVRGPLQYVVHSDKYYILLEFTTVALGQGVDSLKLLGLALLALPTSDRQG